MNFSKIDPDDFLTWNVFADFFPVHNYFRVHLESEVGSNLSFLRAFFRRFPCVCSIAMKLRLEQFLHSKKQFHYAEVVEGILRKRKPNSFKETVVVNAMVPRKEFVDIKKAMHAYKKRELL